MAVPASLAGRVQALSPQFQGGVRGRTLILDGDGPLYAVAATVKTLPTAIKHAQMRFLEAAFLAKAEDVRVHLTANTSHKAGRFHILAQKPYQGNRSGKDKPPLLEPLREAMAHDRNWLDEFQVILHHRREADDGMIEDAWRLGEAGVIRSEDKDLRMTPYPYYCLETARVMESQGFGYVELKYTPSGSPKASGQGLKFFWLQMLMGDTADNVKGLLKMDGKLCGPVAAVQALVQQPDEFRTVNFVIDQYRKIDQNPIPEAYLLWLLRSETDHVWSYLQSCPLTDENRDFLNDCYRRKWYATDDPPNP